MQIDDNTTQMFIPLNEIIITNVIIRENTEPNNIKMEKPNSNESGLDLIFKKLFQVTNLKH